MGHLIKLAETLENKLKVTGLKEKVQALAIVSLSSAISSLKKLETKLNHREV